MKKIWLVAKREYRATVRRKGFLIATVLLPLMIGVMAVISGGAFSLSMRQSRAKADNIGIVDESGLVQFPLLPGIQKASLSIDTGALPQAAKAIAASIAADTVNLTQFASVDAARAALMRKEIRGYYIIPSDFLQSGNVTLKIRKGAFMSDSQPGWSLVRRLLVASLVEGKLPEGTAKRVWERVFRR